MARQTRKKGAKWDVFLYHLILFVVVHIVFVLIVGVLPLSELGSDSYIVFIKENFLNKGVNIYKIHTVNVISGIWKTVLIIHLIIELIETLFPSKKKESIEKTKEKRTKEKKESPNRAWFYLIVAGLLEIIWATALKVDMLAGPLLITLIVSFDLLIRAVKQLGVGTAYAVFTGIGTAGLVIVDTFVFQEPLSFLKIFFIILLVIFIVGLKWTSEAEGDVSK
ncbi:multidrug efflux SMR transporter [Oceanobacillus luteolus]|uniref:Multidrug efflux SMR transporter n=1 Tax=Oceanobacillus luteolus TaxID=1274358 RepID=A0ABW4HXY4_9BACI